MKIFAAISISISFAAPLSTGNDELTTSTPARRSSQDMTMAAIDSSTDLPNEFESEWVELDTVFGSEEIDNQVLEFIDELDDVLNDLEDNILTDFFDSLQDQIDEASADEHNLDESSTEEA